MRPSLQCCELGGADDDHDDDDDDCAALHGRHLPAKYHSTPSPKRITLRSFSVFAPYLHAINFTRQKGRPVEGGRREGFGQVFFGW